MVKNSKVITASREELDKEVTERKLADERVQDQIQHVTILSDINQAITSTLDLRSVLDLLLDKIDHLLPYSVTTLRLINKESGLMEAVASRNIDEEEWKSTMREGERGFSKGVLQNKGPVRIANVQKNHHVKHSEFLRKYGLISYLGLPLVTKDNILGTLGVYTKEEHQFTSEEIEFLSSLASQAAIAINNSQLYEQVGRRTSELSALHAVTAAAGESLNLDSMLQKVIKKITDVFHFSCTRIFTFNSQMDQLYLRASFETRPEFWSHVRSFRRGEGNVGRVAETGEPLIYEDIQGDPRYQKFSHTKNTQGAKFRFMTVFPIKVKQRVLGTLVCIDQDPRHLTSDEVQLIISMTDQIGIAVENATLFEETKGKAKELSALYSVATAVNQSLDIDFVLRSAMHQVQELFNFDAARIYFLSEDEKKLYLFAHEGFPKEATPSGSFMPGQGIIGKVFETGEARFFGDLENDPEFQKLASSKVGPRAGFQSSLIMPVGAKGKTLGVINFLGKRPRRFPPNEVELVHSIANHVGVAVENARLFKQTKQQAIDLKKLNKVKDEFLSIMSHELRTPLNVVMGYVEMIKDESLGGINPKQKEALGKVLRHADYQLDMVNSILYATNLEANIVKLNSHEVGLKDFLDDLRSDYRVPSDKELTLTWDYPPDLPFIKTDSVKLKQILQNLINNAVKFTEKDSVTVSARIKPDRSQEAVGSRKQTEGNGQIEFQVADTGIGMSKESVPFIFEKFRQLDSSETRGYSGVGLGLYIVKQFTEILGGEVEVDSEVGKGSTFTVVLPYERFTPGE